MSRKLAGKDISVGEDGVKVFHRTPLEDEIFEMEQRQRLMRRLYGGQQ